MSASDKIVVNSKKKNAYPLSLAQQQLLAAKRNPNYKFPFKQGYWTGSGAGKDSTNEVLFQHLEGDFNRGGFTYGTRYVASVALNVKKINRKMQKIQDEIRDLGMLEHNQRKSGQKEAEEETKAQIAVLQAELTALNDECTRLDEESKNSVQIEDSYVTAKELLEGELRLTRDQAISFALSVQQILFYYPRDLIGYSGNLDFTVEISREEDEKIVLKVHADTDPELYNEFEILVSDLQVDVTGKPKEAPIRLVDTQVITTDLKVLISFCGMESFISEKELEEKIASMKNEDELEQFWFFWASLGKAVTDNSIPVERLKKYFLDFRPVQQAQDLPAHDLKAILLHLEQVDVTNEKAVFGFIKDFLIPYIDKIKQLDEFKKMPWLDILEIQAKRDGLSRIRPEIMKVIFELNLKYQENIVGALTSEGQYAYRFVHMLSFLTALQDIALSHERNSLKEVESATVLPEDNLLIRRPQDSLSRLYNEVLTEPTDAVVSIQEIIWATRNLTADEFVQFEIGLSEFAKRYYDDFEFKPEFKNFPGGPNAWREEADLHREAVKKEYRGKFLKCEFLVELDIQRKCVLEIEKGQKSIVKFKQEPQKSARVRAASAPAVLTNKSDLQTNAAEKEKDFRNAILAAVDFILDKVKSLLVPVILEILPNSTPASDKKKREDSAKPSKVAVVGGASSVEAVPIKTTSDEKRNEDSIHRTNTAVSTPAEATKAWAAAKKRERAQSVTITKKSCGFYAKNEPKNTGLGNIALGLGSPVETEVSRWINGH